MVTFSSTLAQIVADVGAGINGWTVYDDQRETTTYLIPTMMGGSNSSAASCFITFTNGRVGVTGTANQTYFSASWLIAATTGTQITNDSGSNFYTVTSQQNNSNASLDRNYTGASTNNHYTMEKPQGYLVLKQTSAQKSFYVKIDRPNTYGDLLRFQTFESWNSTTHSGTNGAPQEIVRAYDNGMLHHAQTKISYIMWLLPDAFAFYGGADPNEYSIGAYNDLFYAGNLTPYRNGDTNCLTQACTNQAMSSFSVSNNPASTTYAASWGASIMLRNAAGDVTWIDPAINGQAAQFPMRCMYAMVPRGRYYLHDTTRTQLDMDGRQNICDIEMYSCGPVGLFQNSEPKRGSVKHLRLPMFNPSGMNLTSFGPCDDGNTYIMVRVSFPFGVEGVASPTTDQTTTKTASGFSLGQGFSTAAGEISPNNLSTLAVPRFFLLPINL